MRISDYATHEQPYGVHLFGTPHNWSIKDLRSQADLSNDEVRYAYIADTIAAHGSRRVYAPHPTFERNICTPDALETPITFHNDVVMYRGYDAEGVVVEHGDNTTVYFSTADCAIVVLTSYKQKRSVVFHAGRDSLLNRNMLNLGMQPNSKDSVVWNAYNALFLQKEVRTLKDIIATIHLSAGPGFVHRTDDERYGPQNGYMRSFIKRCWGEDCFHDWENGELLVHKVIESQLINEVGLQARQIEHDGYDTRNDQNNGAFVWHSQSRNPNDRKGSNAVIVYIP